MCGRLAAEAEVAGGVHQAGAEMVQPEAIDEHAGGERIVLARNGAGQLEAAAAFLEGLPWTFGQYVQELPGNHGSGIAGIAANEYVRLHRIGIDQDHGPRRGARRCRLPGVHLFLQGRQFVAKLAIALGQLRLVRFAEPGHILLQLFELLFKGKVGGGSLRRADQGQIFRLGRAGKDAVQRVVIFGRDRIVLGVVTAGAGDGQAHEAATDHVDAVVDDVVNVVEEAAAQGEITHGRQRTLVRFPLSMQTVRRQLLHDELIVRQVFVEGADHIIPVGVGIGVTAFLGEQVALGIGIAGDIEPVPAPALAVVG